MLSYEVFSQSVQGASHIKKGMPCEDYGIAKNGETYKLFVLGDGHGDSNCPRSSIGSRLVCEIASEELERFVSAVYEEDWVDRILDKFEVESVIAQLVTSIFGKWSCAVDEDYYNNPLSSEELEKAEEYKVRYLQGQRIEHIYGTTMIAGIMTADFLLLLQQGDGRCDVFDCNGNVSQPIPWDDRCFANITTSVCDTDAVQSCRYHIIDLNKNPIIACIAGSDGVEDSFSTMEKVHAFYRGLLNYACAQGVEDLEHYLADYLPEFSANGSGDDTTICGIIDIERTKLFLPKFDAENEEVSIRDEIASADERINSMEAKLRYLKEKTDDVSVRLASMRAKLETLEDERTKIAADLAAFSEDEADQANPELEEASERLESLVVAAKRGILNLLSQPSIKWLSKRLEILQQEKENVESEISTLAKQKEVADNEYLPYKERYDKFVQMKEAATQRLRELALEKQD